MELIIGRVLIFNFDKRDDWILWSSLLSLSNDQELPPSVRVTRCLPWRHRLGNQLTLASWNRNWGLGTRLPIHTLCWILTWYWCGGSWECVCSGSVLCRRMSAAWALSWGCGGQIWRENNTCLGEIVQLVPSLSWVCEVQWAKRNACLSEELVANSSSTPDSQPHGPWWYILRTNFIL